MDEERQNAAEETSAVPRPPVPSTAGEVLRGLSFASYTASAVLALLVLVVWGLSANDRAADFPGRYLMVLLPLLAAAWAFDVRATDLDRRAARRRL